MAIEFPVGSLIQGEPLAVSIPQHQLKNIVAAQVGNQIIDLHTPLTTNESVIRLLTPQDPEALFVLRHSTAHVMADAVQRLFPQAKVTIGPATQNGFYYDFDYEPGFSAEDLERIEAQMRAIISQGQPFKREYLPREQMLSLFAQKGEFYKQEIIEAIASDEPLSLYRHGEFVDLCRGPHLPHVGFIRAIKLTHTAGAYWRGDERNKMLQRIYGLAFFDQAALDQYLKQQEELKKRDHRKLGKELELFVFHPWAPASPFFLPRGALIYNTLVDWMRQIYKATDYQEVITPQIFDMELFKCSGHYDSYRDNMFCALPGDAKAAEEESGREFGQKPMNCPSHCLLFASQHHSYRDLPLRIADFGRLHRYERSGVVAGLTRVRTFCQDDAHVFCAASDVQKEISAFIDLLTKVYRALDIQEWSVALSTKPQNALGSDEVWQLAEDALHQALTQSGVPYSLNPGEGAFYGPKIEFHIKDALGRVWQLGTVQVDFVLPERFSLGFVNSNNQEERPVMLHRAIFGSLERFIGVYLEHTAGKLPAWLAPEQVRIVTISDEQSEYAFHVLEKLKNIGIRAHFKASSEKLGAKIRDAQMMKIPVTLVIGKKEVAERTLSAREFGSEATQALGEDALLEWCQSRMMMPRIFN